MFTDELISGVEITELLNSIKSSDSRGQSVFLLMPIFKIEYNSDELKGNLEELGVRRAFSDSLAEFGNLKVGIP